MDDLQRLRDRHDALPAPDPAAMAEARSRLHDHMRAMPSPGRRFRPVWGLGLAGATAGALLLATTIGTPGTDTDTRPESPRLRPVANAQDLAHNAAILAAGTNDTFKPAQWAYVKTVYARVQEGGGRPLFGRPKGLRTDEKWRRTDDRGFAVIENGRLKVADISKYEPTYRSLLSLPTEPVDLLAAVYKQVDAGNRSPLPTDTTGMSDKTRKKYEEARRHQPAQMTPEERNTRAFQLIERSMRDAALPARLRAAMYGALAKIPGVRYEARASDIAERPGVTLYRIQNGHLRDEILIQPKTYAYMGFRSIAVRDHTERGLLPVTKGQIIGWGGVLAATLVDKPGRRS
ncbi:CU044_5270 family protein [Thermomonospora umbrina]|uniref:CU044_5270 family protein n=1 Tax=Thermomonospora umbrina TaxID=111806 RepID=A0A3D9SP56_9ACTN|nr:CU044_5270 family protein [Thermomonospora umbrina]REE97742.1 hypothetical protein DFJ69_3217 [Thermomonospora umbrina]